LKEKRHFAVLRKKTGTLICWAALAKKEKAMTCSFPIKPSKNHPHCYGKKRKKSGAKDVYHHVLHKV
jgi:hypothetical protein